MEDNKNEVIIVGEDDLVVEKPEAFEVLDKDEAEQLTKDIQSTTTALYVLLKRAHETKAWLSLGYKTWTEYIENEFDFSRARSYQLINQANVIEEINDASGVPLYITEKEARSIKKRLPEITERLKEVKDSDLSETDAKNKVKEIIEEKEEIDNSSDGGGSGGGNSEGGGPDEFQDEDAKEEYNPENKISNKLSEDDRFYFENLLVTLKIFESMPNAALLGEKIKKSNEDKKELIKLAENSSAWITKMLNEIQ